MSFTCRRFHLIFTTVVEDLFDRWPSPSESESRRRDQDLYKTSLFDVRNAGYAPKTIKSEYSPLQLFGSNTINDCA